MLFVHVGEAANVASVPQSESLGGETTLQAREQINNMIERYSVVQEES